MTWNGEERRRDAQTISQVKDELGSVRAALYEVAEGMRVVAPRAEVHNLVDRERRERNRLMAVISLAVVIMLLFVWQLRDFAHSNRDIIRTQVANQTASSAFAIQAVKCILYQLSEHRLSNQKAHDTLGHAHGVNDLPKTPLPAEPTGEQLVMACAPFLTGDPAGGVLESTPTTIRSREVKP